MNDRDRACSAKELNRYEKFDSIFGSRNFTRQPENKQSY